MLIGMNTPGWRDMITRISWDSGLVAFLADRDPNITLDCNALGCDLHW